MRAVSGPLSGKVALVAGATRGAGRGTAVSLGEAGAIVYCTGRTTRERRSEYDRPETIEETAELVGDAGGVGIAVAVDHLEPAQVAELVRRIDAEHGCLDVLVNDIWGGERLFEWNKPVWEHDLENGLRMLRLAIDTHLITSHFALPSSSSHVSYVLFGNAKWLVIRWVSIAQAEHPEAVLEVVLPSRLFHSNRRSPAEHVVDEHVQAAVLGVDAPDELRGPLPARDGRPRRRSPRAQHGRRARRSPRSSRPVVLRASLPRRAAGAIHDRTRPPRARRPSHARRRGLRPRRAPPFRKAAPTRQASNHNARLTEAAGIWTIQTGIFPENAGSIRLRERVGFELVGRRKRLGKVDGQWRDVLLLERRGDVVD